MDTKRICPGCQRPLTVDAPQGLCPECLMKAGFSSGVAIGDETRSGQPRFVAPLPQDLSGKFPQLEILSFIGQGGMGAVYKARQKQLDRIVALKILPPGIGDDPAFAERFAREAKALAKLDHPGIVTIHDFGQTDGLFFFVMEFVDGVNLRQLLQTGRVSPREALAIVPQICDALQFAHDQGIVHRDIKPENILLDRRGRVKVADFGLAKLVEARGIDAAAEKATASGSPALTAAGKIMGTPNYIAPEQIEHPHQVDHRADIYALGVVLYQMLTGELPGKPLRPPSSKVHIDVRLDEIVLRALEKEPELRYQQVSEVKTDVEAIVTSAPPSSESAAATMPGEPKISPCYVSTPGYLKTFRGRFLRIYEGQGELCLDAQALHFRGGWQSVTIPLSSIQSIAQGWYPASVKPDLISYIAVTFIEHGKSRTLLFTPTKNQLMLSLEIGKVAVEWLNALQEAIRIHTGKSLPIRRSDVAQERFWPAMIKGFLFSLASCTAIFALIPLLTEHRLPRGWKELMWAPLTVGFTYVGLLIMRWWRTSFPPGGNKVDRASNSGGSRPIPIPAKIGMAWIVLFVAVSGWLAIWSPFYPDMKSLLRAIPAVPFGLAGAVASTICGWMAVQKIRRSEGKLGGLRLALFVGLLFPLLSLDAAILGLWMIVAREFAANVLNLGDSLFSTLADAVLWTILAVASVVWIDCVLIRRVWRAVNQPLNRETKIGSPPLSSSSSSSSEGTHDGATARRRQGLQRKSAFFFIAATCFLIAATLFALSENTIAAALNVIGVIGFGLAGYRHLRAAATLTETSGTGPDPRSPAWAATNVGFGVCLVIFLAATGVVLFLPNVHLAGNLGIGLLLGIVNGIMAGILAYIGFSVIKSRSQPAPAEPIQSGRAFGENVKRSILRFILLMMGTIAATQLAMEISAGWTESEQEQWLIPLGLLSAIASVWVAAPFFRAPHFISKWAAGLATVCVAFVGLWATSIVYGKYLAPKLEFFPIATPEAAPLSKTSAPHETAAVKEVALQFTAAIRDRDDKQLKALSCDSMTRGWINAVPHFGDELRNALTHFGVGFEVLGEIEEVLVEGDVAAVKTAHVEKPKAYLVLFFHKTPEGWRNCSLRNSPDATPLSEHLKRCVAEIHPNQTLPK